MKHGAVINLLALQGVEPFALAEGAGDAHTRHRVHHRRLTPEALAVHEHFHISLFVLVGEDHVADDVVQLLPVLSLPHLFDHIIPGHGLLEQLQRLRADHRPRLPAEHVKIEFISQRPGIDIDLLRQVQTGGDIPVFKIDGFELGIVHMMVEYHHGQLA